MSLKGKLRPLVERTSLGYRLMLARDRRAMRRPARPNALWHNAVLQTERERDFAMDQIRSLGLPMMQDRAKNWDSLAALDCILSNTTRHARVLDAGAELYSVILPWLFLYGYRRLQGINLVFTSRCVGARFSTSTETSRAQSIRRPVSTPSPA